MADTTPKVKGKKKAPAKIPSTFDGVPKKQARSSVFATMNKRKEAAVMTYLSYVYRLMMDMDDSIAGAKK